MQVYAGDCLSLAEIHLQISNFEQFGHAEIVAYLGSQQEVETIVRQRVCLRVPSEKFGVERQAGNVSPNQTIRLAWNGGFQR